MEQLQALLGNLWIGKYGGPWDSRIVLAMKPHQKHVQNIYDFIWIIFVSYRKLNGIEKSSGLHVPRCYDAIRISSYGSNKIWIISLDARQGYHQISVRHIYRENQPYLHQTTKNIHSSLCHSGPLTPPISILYSYTNQQMKNK